MACARLGPAAAFIDGPRGQAAACEENRLTRARQVAMTGRPALAIAELLDFLQRRPEDVGRVAVVNNEDQSDWAQDSRAVPVDGHMAHAAYAFHSSPHDEAYVLVCEVHRARGWTAWKFASGQAPVEVGQGLGAFPLARIYGTLTEALGFQATRDEHVVEALARAGKDTQARLADLIALTDDGVQVDPTFADAVRTAASASENVVKDIAASVQRRLGECLAVLLRRLAEKPAPDALCLSGGLFFNTYFTTVAATCGAFDRVHVPPHPGRNGTAVGAAILAASPARIPTLASPYLGPAYADQTIKQTLENCKLSFDLQREDRLMDEVLRALSRGRLVGWFHGRLEWGPRALGHRSVLADPLATHTLDNLNGFLKRRPSHRTYGVSVPLSQVQTLFDGPLASPFMQFDYRPRDPERFRSILPSGVETLRVHTVDASEPRFLRLLELWGEKTGTPALVNTSFNGFHEPLVCSPRDAIRVFYGTGLDLLALEDFVVRK
jgi:carbamoyltransferase